MLDLPSIDTFSHSDLSSNLNFNFNHLKARSAEAAQVTQVTQAAFQKYDIRLRESGCESSQELSSELNTFSKKQHQNQINREIFPSHSWTKIILSKPPNSQIQTFEAVSTVQNSITNDHDEALKKSSLNSRFSLNHASCSPTHEFGSTSIYRISSGASFAAARSSSQAPTKVQEC
jgi:hypothetical protein